MLAAAAAPCDVQADGVWACLGAPALHWQPFGALFQTYMSARYGNETRMKANAVFEEVEIMAVQGPLIKMRPGRRPRVERGQWASWPVHNVSAPAHLALAQAAAVSQLGCKRGARVGTWQK